MSEHIGNIRLLHNIKGGDTFSKNDNSEVTVTTKWTSKLPQLRAASYNNLIYQTSTHTLQLEIVSKDKPIKRITGKIGISTTIVTQYYIVVLSLDRKLNIPYWNIIPFNSGVLPFRIYPSASLVDARYYHTTYLQGFGLLSYHRACFRCEIYTIDFYGGKPPISTRSTISDISTPQISEAVEDEIATIFTISTPNQFPVVEIVEVSAVWQRQILWVQSFYPQYLWSIDWGNYTVKWTFHETTCLQKRVGHTYQQWLGLGLWHILPRTHQCPKNPLIGKQSHFPITLGFWYTLNLTGSVLALRRVSLPFAIEGAIHDRIVVGDLQRTKLSIIIKASRTKHILFTHTVPIRNIREKLVSLATFREIVSTKGIIDKDSYICL